MIIRALAEASAHLDVDPGGYQEQATPWCLTLTPSGQFVSLVPLMVTNAQGRPAAPKQPVPKISRTSGVAPQLACDTGVYVFGMAKPPRRSSDPYEPFSPSSRDVECHTAWCQMIRNWDISVNGGDTAASAIRAWLDAGKPGLHRAIPADTKAQRELARGNVVIQVEGQSQAAHLSPSAIRFWQEHVAAAKSSTVGRCTSCGGVGPLADSFPTSVPVQLVPGSDQTTGAALTSGNFATASRDLSVTQMRNASICLTCAIQSVAALTALASDPHHHWRSADALTVWWLRSGADAPILNWLDQPPAPSTVHQVLDQVRAGQPCPEVGDLDDYYYAVTYSGREARIVIRSWICDTLGSTATAIGRYLDDSAMSCADDPNRLWRPLWLLAQCTGTRRVKHGSVVTAAPPHARAGLIQAALTGVAPLAALLSAATRRSRAEISLARSDDPKDRHDWSHREHARASLIRLTLNRSPHLNGDFTVPGPDLDADNPDTAYLCGRLFAEYESLQYQAHAGSVNATITDRTYGKAMTSPLLVYPTLDRLSKAHLRKLRTSGKGAAAHAIDARITDLMVGIGDLPAALDVARQARWMLGYYQQRAANLHAAKAHKASSTEASPPEPAI